MAVYDKCSECLRKEFGLKLLLHITTITTTQLKLFR